MTEVKLMFKEKDLYDRNQTILKEIAKNVDAQLTRVGEGIPYYPTEGKYDDLSETDLSWWTNGFYAGMLWQLDHWSKKSHYRVKAIQIEELLAQALADFTGLHHDVGFMYLHTSVAHYKKTGNQTSYVRGLKAANLLAARYNLKGQFIRAWNEDFTGWAIIDSMMNIPLLHWASGELKDPRFTQIANSHAMRLAECILRPDGSSGHVASFEAQTGKFLGCVEGQGYSPESSWTRGQGWAIYGFALSYKYEKNPVFLEKAIKAADYYLEQVALTGFIPRIDFNAPAVTDDVDTSAAIIASCGLLELEKYVDEEKSKIYRAAVERTLITLLNDWCNLDPNIDGILYGGTVAYHHPVGRNVALVYADYFLVEALLKLIGAELDVW